MDNVNPYENEDIGADEVESLRVYSVDCRCGRKVEFGAGRAGCDLQCQCGGWLRLPSLHQLNRASDGIQLDPTTNPENEILTIPADRPASLFNEAEDSGPAPSPMWVLARRLCAFVTDAIPLGVCVWLFSVYFLGFDEVFREYQRDRLEFRESGDPNISKTLWLIFLQAVGVFVVYSTLMHASRLRGTVGKQIFGLEVVRLNSERNAWLLFSCRAFFAITTFFSLFAKLWSRSSEAWHDQIAQTRVVRVKKLPLIFCLSLFLIYVLAVPVSLSLICIGVRYNTASKQAKAIKSIERLGAYVYFESEDYSQRSIFPNVRNTMSRLAYDFLMGRGIVDRVKAIDYWHHPKLREKPLSTDETDSLLLNATRIFRLRNLRLLDISLNDQQFDRIVSMRYLEGLGVPAIEVSDENLEKISRLPKLKVLNISGTSISKRGLEILKQLDQLEFLYLNGKKVSIEAEDELQASLPSCNIFGPSDFQRMMKNSELQQSTIAR